MAMIITKELLTTGLCLLNALMAIIIHVQVLECESKSDRM